MALSGNVQVTPDAVSTFGAGLLNRLTERARVSPVCEGDDPARVYFETLARFVRCCGLEPSRPAAAKLEALLNLVDSVATHAVSYVRATGQPAAIDVAASILLGKGSADLQTADGALLFQAEGLDLPIYHQQVVAAVSSALSPGDAPTASTRCALTGERLELVTGNFPQPNLPELGQTWLFAKNREAPANRRYRRAGSHAMPVGETTAMDLQAALQELAATDRKNITWRPILSEKGGRDLLIAYANVDGGALLGLLADDGFDDDEASANGGPGRPGPAALGMARFTALTKRLLATYDGAPHESVHRNPVRLMIIRKIDPANRKVVYSGTPTVGDLHDAATAWAEGEQNTPEWLGLPMQLRGNQGVLRLRHLHLAPMSLVDFARRMYLRDGSGGPDIPGQPASEAMGFFLVPDASDPRARHHATRWLGLTIRRRKSLLCNAAHALHRNDKARLRGINCAEVLRTLSVLGVCLLKLSRERKVYMEGPAFKLGQLLAVADAVHAGYCADVRTGAMPPSLLGNQFFGMVQANPTAGLAALSRRWKPYSGWASKAARDIGRFRGLTASSSLDEKDRGWLILNAIRQAREVSKLAAELAPAVSQMPRADDLFKAEMLLGYLAGLPREQRPEQAGLQGSTSTPEPNPKEES
jgi:hypothetical protein